MSFLNRSSGALIAMSMVAGLASIQPAFAADSASLYSSASVGDAERQSTLVIIQSDNRVQSNDQLMNAMAQIEGYQKSAGKMAQTMGSNFSVKRMGVNLQDDHDRLDSPMRAAEDETAMPVDEAAMLPSNLAHRLTQLQTVSDKDFDKAFLAAEIETSGESLAALGAYKANDLGSAQRAALAMLTGQLQSRMAQEQALQRDLQ